MSFEYQIVINANCQLERKYIYFSLFMKVSFLTCKIICAYSYVVIAIPPQMLLKISQPFGLILRCRSSPPVLRLPICLLTADYVSALFYIEGILTASQGNKILYYVSSMPFIRRKNDRFRQCSIFYEFYSYFCQKYVGNMLSLLCICAILFPVSDFK